MNKEDIEHMWKVASNNPSHDSNWHDPIVVAFAKLVASAEREACAKVCENIYEGDEACGDWPTPEMCANAIRARGRE